MGCPDWPKCFGRWIPPISAEQLPANYKELYAFRYIDTSFNAYHTWIEYINRLLGALLGLLLIVQFFWSLTYRKTNIKTVWLSLTLLLLTGFQGWLGSKVVETNLEAVKVTTHLLVALIIAALSITIINLNTFNKSFINNKRLKNTCILLLILLLIQIILGTQVREQIDHISAELQFKQRDSWIRNLNYIFYIHRTLSIVVAAVCVYLYLKYRKYFTLQKSTQLMLFCVLGNISLGIIMAYFDMPAFAQPLHLLLSAILIITVYYIWLRTV
jgi:cytochrome c oxidase assembly protein subunit 15